LHFREISDKYMGFNGIDIDLGKQIHKLLLLDILIFVISMDNVILANEDNHLDKEKNIESMKEIINMVPQKYYADILYDSLAKTSIKKSQSGDIISIPHSRGYVFRIFNGKRFTEVADSNIISLKRHVKKLLSNVPHYHNIVLRRFEPNHIDVEIPMKKDISQIPINKKIDKIHKIYSIIQDLDDSLINTIISYQDTLLKRIFLNTEGSVMRQVIPRTRILVQPIVKVNHVRDFDYLLMSHEGGFEIIDKLGFEKLSELVKSSKMLCTADSAPTGKMPVILDPSMSGLIAHESFGHGLEADQFIRERSFLIPFLDKKIAGECVNISDSAVEEGVIGTYVFDDEGIVAKKTRLVENGVLSNLIHNRMTSTLMDSVPHGNGRRESFLNPIYPRMSNTFFEPGSYDLDEMIQETKEGIYLLNGFYGKEDPLGGSINCSSRKAYMIEDGEITKLLKGASINGDLLEFFQSIIGSSKEDVVFDGGICGKGIEDHIPITSGGVHIKSEGAFINPI